MTIEIVYFLPAFLALGFLAFAFAYKEIIAGYIGGLLLFVFGVSVLINPINGLESLINDILGNAMWAYGAYIVIRISIDELTKRGVLK